MYETPAGSHFHIKWSRKDNLDWECFDNFQDATNRAKELAAPGEGFTIQMVLTACPVKGFKAHLSNRAERTEYSLVDQSHSEMQAARSEWERAAEELKQALELFRDLNTTPASPDGKLALKQARLRESDALRKYQAALKAYAAAAGANS